VTELQDIPTFGEQRLGCFAFVLVLPLSFCGYINGATSLCTGTGRADPYYRNLCKVSHELHIVFPIAMIIVYAAMWSAFYLFDMKRKQRIISMILYCLLVVFGLPVLSLVFLDRQTSF
jgi:ABC-type transport system involved in cytochrome c biogenesis permease component